MIFEENFIIAKIIPEIPPAEITIAIAIYIIILITLISSISIYPPLLFPNSHFS